MNLAKKWTLCSTCLRPILISKILSYLPKKDWNSNSTRIWLLLSDFITLHHKKIGPFPAIVIDGSILSYLPQHGCKVLFPDIFRLFLSKLSLIFYLWILWDLEKTCRHHIVKSFFSKTDSNSVANLFFHCGV